MKAIFTRWGLARDYRGAHVSLEYKGRIYLGEIKDIQRDDQRGIYEATVQHFNGEPWPFNPALGVLDILDRTYTEEE